MDLTTPRAATARIPWRAMGVLALIAILMAAAIALYAGSQRHVPPPFGPAVNGLIPYVVNGDIFVGDPVTGTTRLVVGGPGNDNTASFSPDGTQISFLRDMPTGEDIYVARADGSDVRKIMSAPLGGLATVGWTPDQRWACSSATTSTTSSASRSSMPRARPRQGCSPRVSRPTGPSIVRRPATRS